MSRVWAAFTYQKPTTPLSPKLAIFQQVSTDRPDSFWRVYRVPRDAGQASRPSHAIKVAKEFSKLSQIIHQTITEWCGAHGKITARGILQLYREYLLWNENLPEHLSGFENQPTSTDKPLAHAFALQ
jgi:hypothetical protein